MYSEPGRGTSFKIYLPRAKRRFETSKPAVVARSPLGESTTEPELDRILADAGVEVGAIEALARALGEGT